MLLRARRTAFKRKIWAYRGHQLRLIAERGKRPWEGGGAHRQEETINFLREATLSLLRTAGATVPISPGTDT